MGEANWTLPPPGTTSHRNRRVSVFDVVVRLIDIHCNEIGRVRKAVTIEGSLSTSARLWVLRRAGEHL